MNEVFICLINYHLILFTPYQSNKQVHVAIGWSAIITLTIALLANLIYIAFHSARDSFLKLRTRYYLWLRDNLEAKRKLRVKEDYGLKA